MQHKWLDWYKDRSSLNKRLPDLEGDSEWVPVLFVLEMEPSEFKEVQDDFIQQVAEILDVITENVIVVDIQPGCTKVIAVIPRSKLDELRLLLDYDEGRTKTKLPKKLERLVREFRLQQFSRVPTGNLVFIVPKKLTVGREFTWLHLSDAHFQAESEAHHYGQNKVASPFLRDLPNLLDEEGIEPDTVFFTGDVAHSGNPTEYETAFSFLNDLRETLPKPAGMMFVPGNHDVDRDVVQRYLDEDLELQKSLNGNDQVNTFLTAKSAEPIRKRVFERMAAFFEFAQDCKSLGQPHMNHDYFFTSLFDHEGCKIGVAGLNSSWRCKDNQDAGRLILGVPQLDRSIKDLEDADLKLMLIHHPPESHWFTRPDLVYQRHNLKSFDLGGVAPFPSTMRQMR